MKQLATMTFALSLIVAVVSALHGAWSEAIPWSLVGVGALRDML